MPVFYKSKLNDSTQSYVDLDDIFVRKDVFASGGLWGWGQNVYTATSTSSPIMLASGDNNWKTPYVKIDGSRWTPWDNPPSFQSGYEWVNVAHNDSIYNFNWGVTADGLLWRQGDATYSQIANATALTNITSYSGMYQAFKQVAVGTTHAMALASNGRLYGVGRNNVGQLGLNNRTNATNLTEVLGTTTDWAQVSAGYEFTAAVKTNGTLWLWGDNVYGQLGNNSTFPNRSSPIQTTAGGSNWKQVTCGDYHTAAIKTDGTLWCWGQNFYGNLGTGDTSDRLTPTQTVSGGSNWKFVDAGRNTTGAIKTDTTLWMWGENGSGKLGDGTTTNRNSPAQTLSGGTGWKTIDILAWSTYAVKY